MAVWGRCPCSPCRSSRRIVALGPSLEQSVQHLCQVRHATILHRPQYRFCHAHADNGHRRQGGEETLHQCHPYIIGAQQPRRAILDVRCGHLPIESDNVHKIRQGPLEWPRVIVGAVPSEGVKEGLATGLKYGNPHTEGEEGDEDRVEEAARSKSDGVDDPASGSGGGGEDNISGHCSFDFWFA